MSLENDETPEATSSPQAPSPRNIYRYHNGTKDVCADPAVLWRKINSSCVERSLTWDGICTQWIALSPKEGDDANTASDKTSSWLILQESIASIVCSAFNLTPLDDDGNGLTESEIMEVLASFLGDREKKDEPTANSPSSSAPTAGGRRGSSKGCSAGAKASPTRRSTG